MAVFLLFRHLIMHWNPHAIEKRSKSATLVPLKVSLIVLGEDQLSWNGPAMEEGLDRREGKGRRCCSGDITD